jgi:hypothetical protein
VARGEKGFETPGVAVSRFTQHPANRLVNQVVRIVQQDVGDAEGLVQIALPDEAMRRHDGNPALPQIL